MSKDNGSESTINDLPVVAFKLKKDVMRIKIKKIDYC
jgi:hypothetical protein